MLAIEKALPDQEVYSLPDRRPADGEILFQLPLGGNGLARRQFPFRDPFAQDVRELVVSG